jgi:phage tail-like protein
MANPGQETTSHPFTSFNFAIEINVGGDAEPLCNASFSDCDGIEMTMDVKTIREGGNNGRQIRLPGPATFGTLTLKRGMTSGFDLWRWMERASLDPGLRASAEVVIFGSDGQKERARFVLDRCLPVKVKAPVLNAKDGTIAVEELQVAYEAITLKRPG